MPNLTMIAFGSPCRKCGSSVRLGSGKVRRCAPCRVRWWNARKAARAGGFDGTPCGKCGTTRKRPRGCCVECERQRDWQRRENDPDKLRGGYRKWRAENLDYARKQDREYWKLNPEKARHRNRVRRARLLNAPGQHTPEQAELLRVLQHGKCAYCEAPAEHLDHKTPLSRGGGDDVLNLQWLCAFHNQSKNAKTDEEYRDLIGLPQTASPLTRALLAAAAV